jgi:hypothetical protein
MYFKINSRNEKAENQYVILWTKTNAYAQDS